MAKLRDYLTKEKYSKAIDHLGKKAEIAEKLMYRNYFSILGAIGGSAFGSVGLARLFEWWGSPYIVEPLKDFWTLYLASGIVHGVVGGLWGMIADDLGKDSKILKCLKFQKVKKCSENIERRIN